MNKYYSYYITVLLFFFLIKPAFAQNATIRGSVLDKENGEPVIYTNVTLKGTTLGAQTNDDGFYVITNIPPGTYRCILHAAWL